MTQRQQQQQQHLVLLLPRPRREQIHHATCPTCSRPCLWRL
jgi:hypothetical protein